MKKIKIVQLVDSLELGGLETVVKTICREIDHAKYDIEVWCMAYGGTVADELENDGYTVKVFNVTTYLNPLNVFRLASQLRKSKVAIVHAHGFFCQVIGAMSGVLAGTPIRIAHFHTTLEGFTWPYVWRNRIINRFVHKVIYISKAVCESALQAGCRHKGKGIIVYNGIDGGGWHGQLASSQKNIVTIVSSLAKHKGHRYLLQTIKQLVDSFPDINLWIVGNGPLRGALEQEAKDLDIAKNVTFWGEQSDIIDVLNQTKIFVLSSLREGLSLAVIEAMAQGRPVVAHRVGGIPEVVEDGVTGYLVEPKDSKQFAEKIAMLLSDPDKQDQMGKEARSVFERKFSSKIMMNQINRIYDDLIQAKIPSR